MSKHPSWVLLPLSLACACAFANTGDEGESQELNPVVVSGTPTGKANSVQFNPKTSIQPLPANDGASVLQSVPNMSIIRKGGSSGDPLLRGLGGSRLSIQADGQFIYGGCGNRMDPPTAYIFPASFDKVIVTKGPQSVSEGMGMVAGSVRFVRKTPPKAEEFKAHGNAGLTVGSFDRFDIFADAELNNRYGYLRANASYNKSGNYRRRRQPRPLPLQPPQPNAAVGRYSHRKHRAFRRLRTQPRRSGLRRPHDGRQQIRPRRLDA